jgi:hypothetical protein
MSRIDVVLINGVVAVILFAALRYEVSKLSYKIHERLDGMEERLKQTQTRKHKR